MSGGGAHKKRGFGKKWTPDPQGQRDTSQVRPENQPPHLSNKIAGDVGINLKGGKKKEQYPGGGRHFFKKKYWKDRKKKPRPGNRESISRLVKKKQNVD